MRPSKALRSTLYLHPSLSLYPQSLAFVMASAQLAIFKVPAIDNEPMVGTSKISRLFRLTIILAKLWSGVCGTKRARRGSLSNGEGPALRGPLHR